jgi:filamentous hemagglutinin family protein
MWDKVKMSMSFSKKSNFLRSNIISLLFYFSGTTEVLSQISADQSLPLPSIVMQDGSILRIDGGTQKGVNLFHSFKEFSVNQGQTAYFNNINVIQNIFSRVTGNSNSNINGIIKTNGTANLFLINPNGIIFGANASLNIGGSFFASTANDVVFADGSRFGYETNSNLLTISVPIGLDFRGNNGEIRIYNQGHKIPRATVFTPTNISGTTSGLSVNYGSNISLFGNGIFVEGGILTADQGNIQLGSVSNGYVLGIDQVTSYEKVRQFGDIKLSQQAMISTENSINLTGKNVVFSDGSLLLTRTDGNRLDTTIRINAIENFTLNGLSRNKLVPSAVLSEVFFQGKGSDIFISAKNLQLEDGAGIRSRTYGEASGGDIFINSNQFVGIGASPFNPNLNSSISTVTLAPGKAGDITLTTQGIRIVDGAFIGSSTFDAGTGGKVQITNAKNIEISGTTASGSASSINSSSFNNGLAGSVLGA